MRIPGGEAGQDAGERPQPLSAASPRPVRVAIVAASPRWLGGQAVQAELLVRHWRNDPTVEARFIPIDPEIPRTLRWVERIPLLRTLARTPFYLATLWHGMRDVDLAHIFSASYWSFLVAPMPAWLVARLRRKRTLIHYHSGEAEDHLRRSRTALGVLRRTDRLVVPSGYLVDVFQKFHLQAEAVPNFVDLSRFTYRNRQRLRPSLVNTRGVHPYYGIDLVVRAFAQVRQKFPEANLCLVGKGASESGLRALAHDLRLNGVEFAGPIPQDTIPGFYDGADIFINASWLDNAPVSILEAFASGTPVVSTAPEGIRYMVEHERTGLLCDPGDWQALAENVTRLLREPQLASRLAQNAYEEVQNNRWEQVRSRWLQVYESLCRQAAQEGRPQPPASHLTALANRDNQAREQNPEKATVSGSVQC